MSRYANELGEVSKWYAAKQMSTLSFRCITRLTGSCLHSSDGAGAAVTGAAATLLVGGYLGELSGRAGDRSGEGDERVHVNTENEVFKSRECRGGVVWLLLLLTASLHRSRLYAP